MDGELKIACPQWSPHPEIERAGVCAIGKYRNPSLGVCRHCLAHPDEKPQIRGLGDVISQVTNRLGIKECGGCRKRKALLNRVLPLNRA